MKISKLYIDEYKHLKDLNFDFTYPMDFHDETMRGKPLNKICFIGQSATGKTSLLELIFENLKHLLELETIDNKYLFNLFGDSNLLKGELILKLKNEELHYKNESITFNENEFTFSKGNGQLGKLIPLDLTNSLYYLKSSLISDKNIELFSKNPIDLIEKNTVQIENIKISKRNNKLKPQILSFNDKVDESTWLFLICEILDYRKNFTQKMSELIHKGLLANTEKLSYEFKKWQKDNPNTLELFAENFNPILEKLNLEVDIIDTEYSIPIRNKTTDEIIPIQNTSTGTKGLLLSFLPLYKLDTKESIILIDEPERSLYPDMQMDLMDYYQNLAPKAQFIIATHSPFIAASFEPCERFILYFDAEGKVAVRQGTSPIGDDPNDILKNDFELEFLMNEKGRKAFERFRELKRKIATVDDEEEKDKLLDEILTLAKTYKF
ncbi:AAA family ATPase [Flavobacterium davisii]|uniref:AAA family ATPase n=1 Tax=Flavobacterium davisii TaxID=2906077 RepID=UPI0035CE9F82